MKTNNKNEGFTALDAVLAGIALGICIGFSTLIAACCPPDGALPMCPAVPEPELVDELACATAEDIEDYCPSPNDPPTRQTCAYVYARDNVEAKCTDPPGGFSDRVAAEAVGLMVRGAVETECGL
jgi:hypothetical protein